MSLDLETGAKHQLRIHLSKVLNGETSFLPHSNPIELHAKAQRDVLQQHLFLAIRCIQVITTSLTCQVLVCNEVYTFTHYRSPTT